MKTILTISILFFTSLSILSAQTKLIAHKSHSGNRSDFRIALENDLFDMNTSNFGQAPMRIIKNAQLDTLIFLSDTAVAMITSEHCTEIRMKHNSIWQAGRDTVFFHPLFSHQHRKDSIKKVLDESYNFKNPADSVVFINYDNQVPKVEVRPIILEKKEDQKIKHINTKPSKKEIRKAKRTLKRQKKKERKAEKAKKKMKEKQPEIKPASFIPVNPSPPNDPSGFSMLKVFLVLFVLMLAMVVGVFSLKYPSRLKVNAN